MVKEEQRRKGRVGGGRLLLPPAGEWAGQSEAGRWRLGEAGREEAEGLTLIGGQRRSVAIEVSWDAAAGRTRAVTQSLDASLALKFCKTRRGPGPVSAVWGRGWAACLEAPVWVHFHPSAGDPRMLPRWTGGSSGHREAQRRRETLLWLEGSSCSLVVGPLWGRSLTTLTICLAHTADVRPHLRTYSCTACMLP